MNNEELYHFGIKGQKWGVRRFQNKDGSLTPAGKKRYDDDDGKSIEQSHKERLIGKYRDVGVSEEKATKMAEDRIRGEKILLGVAAFTITAAAVYGANKYVKNRTDQIIKAGDVMQRVEMRDTGGRLHDVFYASKGDHDNKRYERVLGFTRKMQTGEAYSMKLRAAGDVKVASKNNAMKAFEELYKNDPEFRESVKPYVKNHFVQYKNRANVNSTNNRNIRKMYENFNSAIVETVKDPDNVANKKFFDALKSKGYGAVQDINDMKFSGYNARNPLIIFDNSKNSVMVESVKEITKDSSYGKAMVEIGKSSAEGWLKKMASPTAAGLSTAAVTLAVSSDYKNYDKNSPDVKYAQNYIKKHPNTNYSIDELRYRYMNGYV